MAREYKVVVETFDKPYIQRVYDEPGLSWRDAKKQLRQKYLDMAKSVRNIRENDAVDPKFHQTRLHVDSEVVETQSQWE